MNLEERLQELIVDDLGMLAGALTTVELPIVPETRLQKWED